MWKCGTQKYCLPPQRAEAATAAATVVAAVRGDGNGQAVLPGTTAPALVELKISVDVPGKRKTEGSVTVVAVGACGSVDECVVEKVNSTVVTLIPC